jgi:hypothetical protein
VRNDAKADGHQQRPALVANLKAQLSGLRVKLARSREVALCLNGDG